MFWQKYRLTIISNVFLLKLWRTELKNELKVCQFLNILQLKNAKKNNLRTSKLNKDLSQIQCFQCCLSIENSNRVKDKTDNCTVSDKQPTKKMLTLIRLQIL